MVDNKKRCRCCRCACMIFTILLISFLAFHTISNILFPGKPNCKKRVGDGLPIAGFHEPESEFNLTSTQMSALTEFREKVKSKIEDAGEYHLKHDIFLVKWLKVAEFDVEQAEKLLTENLQWKKDAAIKTIHEEDWSDMARDYPCNLDGVDHIGQPVLFLNLGVWNIKAATKSGNQERLERFVTKMIDEAVQLVYKKHETDKRITQYFVLADLMEFSFFQGACINCLSVFLSMATTFDQKYPLMAYQIVTVNTPGVFQVVFNFIKPVLSETTKESMYLMGDREEWEPFLLEAMDKDQLPLQLREPSSDFDF